MVEHDGAPVRTRLAPEARRARIRSAAIELVARQGYDVSLGDIAHAAGVQRTVLYHYYRSRSDLLVDALTAKAAEFLEVIVPSWTAAADEGIRANAAIRTFFEYIEDKRDVWALIFSEWTPQDSAVAETRRRVRQTFIANVSAMTTSEQQQRGLPVGGEASEMTSEMLIGAATAVLRWWSQHPQIQPRDIADHFHDVLWNGLGATSEPRDLLR